MTKSARQSPKTKAAPPRDARPRMTTFKVDPDIGAGLRLAAAVQGATVSEFAEQAVRLILVRHEKQIERLPPKLRSGRPGPTISEAVKTIADHPDTRNDAIPARIEETTATSLAELARQLGKRNSQLAEEGALALIEKSGPDLACDLAGLGSIRAQAAAKQVVRDVALGLIRLEVDPETENAKKKQLLMTRVPLPVDTIQHAGYPRRA